MCEIPVHKWHQHFKKRTVEKWYSGSNGKESACNAEDPGSIPGSGRSPREGNGNPLQYSCLENPTDRGAGQATVHWITELDTTMWLIFTFTWLLYLLFSKLPIIDYLVERITRLKKSQFFTTQCLKPWLWDFLGGPVVGTPHMHCSGHDAWTFVGELRSWRPYGVTKKNLMIIIKISFKKPITLIFVKLTRRHISNFSYFIP